MLDNYHLNQLAEPLLVWFLDHARVLPWRERPELTACGSRKSCCSRRKSKQSAPIMTAGWTIFRPSPPWRRLLKMKSCGSGRAWATTRGPAISTRPSRKYRPNTAATCRKIKKDVQSLKGVGDYTAGAILSLAYGQKEPAVDGNVLRIFARLYDIEENILSTPVKKKSQLSSQSNFRTKRLEPLTKLSWT